MAVPASSGELLGGDPAAFERIEQRLTAIDHLFTEAADQWHRAERRQTRAEKRLQWLERLELSRAERTQ